MSTAHPRLPLEELLAYWVGELSEEREAAVEELLFADEETRRRLEVVAKLGASLKELVQRGAVTTSLTVDAVERLEREGLKVRTYHMEPGQVVPCTIAAEDFVAIRIHADFEDLAEVDYDMESHLEGEPPRIERFVGLPVDRRAQELVLVYSGDLIRSLPRATFVYRVSSETEAGSRSLGEFILDHTPPVAG